MRALVTGVAGFIGSNLARALLDEGHRVRGVDCFSPYYDEGQKRSNVAGLLPFPGFEMVEADVASEPFTLLDDVEVVFHQAAQPGVRSSWGDFDEYVDRNIRATQRLLEASRGFGVGRFVFASSSSVYGNARRYPTREDDLPRPHSPYGVTKLAAEHLCTLYADVFGVPAVSLRYFTVYGPAQRPDMLMHRLIDAAIEGRPVPVFGAGDQIREFTFVDDVVRANLLAADRPVPPGSVVNVAGGSEATVAEVIGLVGEIQGRPVEVDRRPREPGDVARTGGAIDAARELLGWRPEVPLREGLEAQIEWHRARHPGPAETSEAQA